MTPSQRHSLELARLQGIRINTEDESVIVAMGKELDLSYLDGKPGLRILPADEPLNPTLVRWNRKAKEWLPKLERIDLVLVRTFCAGLGVAFWVWIVGKIARWW